MKSIYKFVTVIIIALTITACEQAEKSNDQPEKSNEQAENNNDQSKKDYLVRSKMTEVIGIASAHKTYVTEYFQAMGSLPESAQMAGMNTDPEQSAYITGITFEVLGGKAVSLKYTINGSGIGETSIDGQIFEMRGTTSDETRITWTCNESNITKKYLPANCK